MKHIGYEVCRNWLGEYQWQDILPREGSPQSGEEDVKAFAPQFASRHRVWVGLAEPLLILPNLELRRVSQLS